MKTAEEFAAEVLDEQTFWNSAPDDNLARVQRLVEARDRAIRRALLDELMKQADEIDTKYAAKAPVTDQPKGPTPAPDIDSKEFATQFAVATCNQCDGDGWVFDDTTTTGWRWCGCAVTNQRKTQTSAPQPARYACVVEFEARVEDARREGREEALRQMSAEAVGEREELKRKLGAARKWAKGQRVYLTDMQTASLSPPRLRVLLVALDELDKALSALDQPSQVEPASDKSDHPEPSTQAMQALRAKLEAMPSAKVGVLWENLQKLADADDEPLPEETGLVAYVRAPDGSRTPITPKQWAQAVLAHPKQPDPTPSGEGEGERL